MPPRRSRLRVVWGWTVSQWQQARAEGTAGSASESGELQSIGAYLKAQRGIRGITLEELAQLTRIPIRSIQRLESGSYDGVSDGFVRGFVRTVAESLGLEPDDTLARMLREPVSEAEAGAVASLLLRRAFAVTAMLAAVVLAAGVIRAVVSSPVLEPPQIPDHVFRHDSVRLLADSQREAAGSARWQAAAAQPAETQREGERAADFEPASELPLAPHSPTR